MDASQLARLYQQETQYHVNPPSFETWLITRQARDEAPDERSIEQRVADIFTPQPSAQEAKHDK